MAQSTTVNIPGAAPIVIPFKMTNITDIKNYLVSEHPSIANMDHTLNVNGDNVTVTFAQKSGTKGDVA